MKLSEENIGSTYDVTVSNSFLDMTPKAQMRKGKNCTSPNKNFGHYQQC